MKRPRKITREQKHKITMAGIDPADWMLVHESRSDYQIVHKLTSEVKTIEK